MSLRIKFLPKSSSKKIVKIGQYLAKVWKKYNSLIFGPPCKGFDTVHAVQCIMRV